MKEKLTLKKPVKKENTLNDDLSVFKSLSLSDVGIRTIGITQGEFENFWKQIKNIPASKNEKEQCLNRLKEACSWFCRGIARINKTKQD